MKAVVMAGGFGTRIQPLTNSVPKPMLPILNRPMMQHIIEKLRDIGITEIVVLLYFKPEIIKNHFKDGSSFGVNITYVLPDDDYGTAGAVKQAERFLDERFIIMSGDLVTDFNLQNIVSFHEEKNSKLTITLTSVPDPLQFGVVIANPEGKIQRFLEKPSWGEVFSDTINTGIYLLEPEILSYIPENTNYDFAKDLFPSLMKEGIDLWGCSATGYWRDVGNPESYRDVQKDILNGKVSMNIRGNKSEYEKGVVYCEEGTTLPADAVVEGLVILGKNVAFDEVAYLRNCVIGDKCSIGKKADITNSCIWDNVFIGEKTVISNSVVCSHNHIGNKVKIAKGAIIAEKCEIGNLASFEKDVVVWPEKTVEDAAIVSNNIIWGGKYKSSIFEGGMVSGRTNIELSCEMSTKLAEAFGSMLPVGSTVFLSRDYHKSSRMLKRAFLAGLLSTGVNAIDFRLVPSNVMRLALSESDDIVAGVHFRQSTGSQMATEILFYTSEALPIDTNSEKNCERIFFRENFRRVNYDDIGELTEWHHPKESYIKKFFSVVHKEAFIHKKHRIAVDLMCGSTFDIFPEILNGLNIDNIILNAYIDDKKLSKLPTLIEKSAEDISKIVKTLEMDIGFLIFPNGQRIQIICQNGKVLKKHHSLLAILSLLNSTTPETHKKRVYLPVSAPDMLDEMFSNLIIERGKSNGLKASKLREYDFIGNLSNNFAFTEFGLNADALFTSIKVLEMLSKADTTMSAVIENMPYFYFHTEKIGCPTALKGKMMRKFMEASLGKEASFIDGVKICIKDKSWILMLPDQHADFLHIFVQAPSDDEGEAIVTEYAENIAKWMKEE